MSTVDNPEEDTYNVGFDGIEFNDDELRGLKLIQDKGKIYQSDFWKTLDVSSRKGSRIAKKLEDKEVIEREDAVYNGHNTYLLKPKYQAEDLDFSLLMAGDKISPFIGEDAIDYQSDAFTSWLMSLVNEKEQKRRDERRQ